MPRETKFTLYLLLLVGTVFGFIVWQKVSHQTDVLAAMRENTVGQFSEGEESSSSPFEEHNRQTSEGKNPFEGEESDSSPAPRKTASRSEEPRQLAQATPPARNNPFEDSNTRGKAGFSTFAPQKPQVEENPFPASGTTVEARKPPRNLFSAVETNQNSPFDEANSSAGNRRPESSQQRKSPFEDAGNSRVTVGENPFPSGNGNMPRNRPEPRQTQQSEERQTFNPFDEAGGQTTVHKPKPQPPQQPREPAAEPKASDSRRANPFDNSFPTPETPPSKVVQAPDQRSPFDEPRQPKPEKPKDSSVIDATPATFNPFDGGNGFMPVKHDEEKKPAPAEPPKKPEPPAKDPFSQQEGSSNGGGQQPSPPANNQQENPFDQTDIAQKPDNDSSVAPPPKFHTPKPEDNNPQGNDSGNADKKQSGGFNPFQDDPIPDKPTSPNSPNPPAYDPTSPGGGNQPPGGDGDQKIPVYRVKMDETYWSISEKLYGSIRYFQALAEYNRHRIPNPKHLRTGMIILAPDAEVLEERYAKLIPGLQQKKDPYAAVKSGMFYTNSGIPMYRVGEDDTLSDIAQKHLGRSTRWVEIYNLNQEKMKGANRLKVGSVIRLPQDASQVSYSSGNSTTR